MLRSEHPHVFWIERPPPMTDARTNSLRRTYEDALVGLASKGNLDPERHDFLPPHLWEALRLRLQAHWREATGEEHAILKIEAHTHD